MAASSKGSFRWTGDDIGGNMLGLGVKLHAGLAAITKYEATEGQNYMRKNAPWTDRTANARQGLFGKAFSDSGGYVIVLYHTMPYGIYLETRWSGKYRIIEPAIQHVGHNVMQSANGLLRRLKGAA